MPKIQHFLIDWFKKNQRQLPWRNSKSAYKIWLSEIILQQTQVVQGTQYYLKFCKAFPSVSELADASENTVFKLWEGLGYYNRAKNLHFTAKTIKNDFNGVFPCKYDEILKLKGIGPYTAAAISSFAFNNPKPLVDGNVFRLYSRLFDIPTPINTSKGQKEFTFLAEKLLSELNVKQGVVYNQAIMEYGALVCTPKTPKCGECGLQSKCLSFKNDSIKNRPIKLKSKPKRERIFSYILFQQDSKFWVEKRLEKDIWNKLYQPFLIEGDIEKISTLDINKDNIQTISKTIKHVLSHQNLHITFFSYELDPKEKFDFLSRGEWITKKQFQEYPFPQVVSKFLAEI
ncbi:MAG: A/G-specific adenine glycosylase [Flavobacteriales bacterium]